MSSKITPRILKGFRDLLPEEAGIKSEMLKTIEKVFVSFGFGTIETPHLEYSDVLLPETADDEVGKQVYRFADNGGRDVCLRYDLTVPLARFVVQHRHQIGIPFKRYAIANVFRGEQPQFGRYREFTQCDFDIVGVKPGAADAEIIQVIASSLQALGLSKFVIRINNRKVMNGLAASLGVADEAIPEMLRIMDKLDKIGAGSVSEQLQGTLSLSKDVAEELLTFANLTANSPEELLSSVAEYKSRGTLLAKGLEELELIVEILSKLEMTRDKFRIDFSIARGLGYYTGFVFETNLTEMLEIGSVCSGGRYDNLTQNFSKDELPGVGGSVGLDRLIAALEALEVQGTNSIKTDVLCMLLDHKLLPEVSVIAETLRSKGLLVEVYPEAAKFKKQFQYAERKNIEYVLIQGEDEIAAGTFTLKNLNTGEQQTLSDLNQLLENVQNSSS